MKKYCAVVALLLSVVFGPFAYSQIFGGRFRARRAQFQCPGPNCVQAPVYSNIVLPGEVVTPAPVSSVFQQVESNVNPVEDLSQQIESDRPSERAAVRVRAGNSCGSGSVCGRFEGGSLILTNAHVVGTRVGRTVGIDCVIDGVDRSYDAKVIMAAYSDRTLTDWAVLSCDGLTEIEPVSLSKEKPTGRHYTRGSPRCVWPLRSTDIVTAEVSDGSPLWRWRPNSIGGQSGSGVWSYDNHHCYGLLTWSWGGLGAGQQTSEIYRQAAERTTAGEPRIDGLEEVWPRSPDVIVENGFYAEQGIDDLPIWWNGKDDDDQGDDDQDDGEELKLSAKEVELIKELRKRSKEAGVDHVKALQIILGSGVGQVDNSDEGRLLKRLRDRAKERNIDFLKLIELILQIIELFRDQSSDDLGSNWIIPDFHQAYCLAA